MFETRTTQKSKLPYHIMLPNNLGHGVLQSRESTSANIKSITLISKWTYEKSNMKWHEIWDLFIPFRCAFRGILNTIRQYHSIGDGIKGIQQHRYFKLETYGQDVKQNIFTLILRLFMEWTDTASEQSLICFLVMWPKYVCYHSSVEMKQL